VNNIGLFRHAAKLAQRSLGQPAPALGVPTIFTFEATDLAVQLSSFGETSPFHDLPDGATVYVEIGVNAEFTQPEVQKAAEEFVRHGRRPKFGPPIIGADDTSLPGDPDPACEGFEEAVSPAAPAVLDDAALMELPLVDAKRLVVTEFERRYLVLLMARAGGSISDGARLSGLDRTNFRRLLQRHGLRYEKRELVELVDEVACLRQLLRDLIDFDMGELPERDALCAVEGPRKLDRMERAWKAAVAEVGPRNQRRFEGDEP